MKRAILAISAAMAICGCQKEKPHYYLVSFYFQTPPDSQMQSASWGPMDTVIAVDGDQKIGFDFFNMLRGECAQFIPCCGPTNSRVVINYFTELYK